MFPLWSNVTCPQFDLENMSALKRYVAGEEHRLIGSSTIRGEERRPGERGGTGEREQMRIKE